MTNEPTQLRRGKAFHKKVQVDWLNTAEGRILIEKAIIKPTGRKGRIDIFVDDDGDFKDSGLTILTANNRLLKI